MAIAIASRTVDGIEIPVAGTWEIDPSHSSVGFTVRHLMVTKVHGWFGAFSGAVSIAERPEDSTVDVSIDAASIDTRDDKRDAHLRSPDFLDVERYPTLRFTGAGLRRTGGAGFELDGDLTIRDVTRRVTLQGTFEGLVPDPWGNTRAGFSATTTIDREDFGLTWNQALETGGVVVGNKVTIKLEVEAIARG